MRIWRQPRAALVWVTAISVVALGQAAGCAPGAAPGVDVSGRSTASMTPEALITLRERVIARLEHLSRHENPQIRANAIEALQAAPGRLPPVVRAGLADDNVGVRFAAAMTVGKERLRDALAWVKPLTADESPVVRAAAVYALRRLGESVDPTPIGQMLTTSPDPRQRAMAAFILGEMGDAGAIPMLKDAARRRLPRASLIQMRLLRLQIAEALVKLGEDSAVETIRAALYPSRPEDLEATALAVQIIGEVGDRRAVDQLIYLMAQTGGDRPPAEVRLAAAAALAQLGLRNGGFVADELAGDANPAIRAQCAFVYSQTRGDEAIGRLQPLLSDASPLVQVAAAGGLLKALGDGASPQRSAAVGAGGG